jgi:hypothetical protein
MTELAVVVAESKEKSPALKAGDSRCLSRARQGLNQASQSILASVPDHVSGNGVVYPTPDDAELLMAAISCAGKFEGRGGGGGGGGGQQRRGLRQRRWS